MRTDDIRFLVRYMYWVNHRLLDAAAMLTAEEFAGAESPTTRDLRATLVHELDVEWSWRLRLQGRPIEDDGPAVELRSEQYTTVEALREHWSHDEADMLAWIESLRDDDLEGAPRSSAAGSRPLWHYVVHVVTHASQQQADAATLLTLAGQSPGELGYLEFLKQTGLAS